VPESQELVHALGAHYRLSPATIRALEIFAKMVADPGEDALADRRELDGLLASRIANSIAALELEPVRRARRMADIGSGLGFPGLVLAAALPETSVTLVEKEARRCAFLRRAVATMGLNHVEVVEQLVQRWSETTGAFDLVTARSVARPRMVISFAAPLLRVGGAVVIWGNPKRDPVKEDEADAAAQSLGLRLAEVTLTTPVGAGPRHLFVYEKVSPTRPGEGVKKIPHASSARRERKRSRAAGLAESHTKALERLERARERLLALESSEESSRDELERVRAVVRKVERKVEVLARRRQRAERKLRHETSDQLP
jgi:16S rRNA (guanine527-N7)-methyltransferase